MIGTNPADRDSFTELVNYTELTLQTINQQQYEEKIVNIPAANTGLQRYVAFVVRGNNGDRWLIDDVSVVTQCLTPTGLSAPTITNNSANLTWTDAAGSGSWEVQVVPFGTPNAATGTPYSGALPYVATSLAAGTTYQFYVRSVCAPAGNYSPWAGPFTFNTPALPADLNFVANFENGFNGFTFVNGTQANKWVVGSATSSSPTYSMYVSNDNGASNTYLSTSASVVHAYRDIVIPVGATEINVAFDWKANGEIDTDVMRVWNTPTAYSPAAGTRTTASTAANNIRRQIGGNFSTNSGWITYSQIINVAEFAGTTRRFVFEWRNDGSDGGNPAAAVDNINISLITCPQPITLLATSPTQDGATLAWTNRGTATSWEIFVVPVADAAPTETSTGIIVSTNPYTVTGLVDATNYKYYVRAVCGTNDKSFWSGPVNFSTTQIPAILPYVQDFETNSGFSLVNATQTNQWFYGTAVSNSPTHSLYVTNDNGVSNAYTVGSGSTVHAYRDILIPAGTTDVDISFDWRNVGETGQDYIRVYAASSAYIPVAGTQSSVAANRIRIGEFADNGTWTNFQGVINATQFAGGTMRLIFEWRNNASAGTNPPGAIDNINLAVVACRQPITLAVTTPTQTGATFTWVNQGTATSWEVFVVPAHEAAPTATSTGVVVTTNSYTPTNLVDGTNYKFYVRAICGPGNVSKWSGPVIISTLQVPTALPLSQDFENSNGFTFTSGSQASGNQANQWFYGTAVSNSPTHALYVTNTQGATNNYSLTSSSVVHAYRDLIVPADASDINISFDWRNVGEAGQDYVRVWAVPLAYALTAGNSITQNATRLPVSPTLTGNAGWDTYTTVFNASSFAGQTMRLVFEWRNNASSGTNPPGAVDNVNVSVVRCRQPLNPVATVPTRTGATLAWTEQGTATTWEIFIVPAGDPAPTDTSTGIITTNNPYTASGLVAGVNYQFYVRSVCGGTDGVSKWTGPANFTTEQIPTNIPYVQNFETENGFTFTNGAETNQWFYGTAVSNSPTHSLYVTNDNGVSNAYTKTATSTVHAYRDITIPATTTDMLVSFDWRNRGEIGLDYVRAWIVPISYYPVAGTQTTPGVGRIPLGANFSDSANWTTFNLPVDVSAYSGTTVRLVFEWRNNNAGGTDPAGAIDNLSLTTITCPQPSLVTVGGTTSSGTTVSWTSNPPATTWEIFVIPAGSPAPTATSTGIVVTDNPHVITGLVESRNYSVYVRSVCSTTDISLWTGPTNFRTLDICDRPINVQVNCLDASSGTFTWVAGSNELSWEVAVGPATGPEPTSGTVVTEPSYYVQGLTPGNYTFYVRAVCQNAVGYSPWTPFAFAPSAQSPAAAQALCAGLLAQPQPSSSNTPQSVYGTVGCLSTTPNPTWYYITLDGTGQVVLNLRQVTLAGQPIDVDFAAFGPFTSLREACSRIGNPLNTSLIVDCSYSASATETIRVTGAPGQVFALLITNFNGQPGNTTISQVSGPSISCIPTVNVGPDRVLCNTTSHNITATVNNPGVAQVYTYQWFEDANPITPTVVSTTSTTQTVTVTTEGTHVYSVVVTMPVPVNSDPVTDQATISISNPFTPPVPAPLILCGDNGTALANLAGINFLGTLDPADYVLVGIYTSQANANSNTGAIDTSVPFSVTTQTLYVVIADANSLTCTKTVPLSIVVNNSATATISYPTPLCTTTATAPVTQTGTNGGAYTAPAGLTIDAVTGTITPSTSTAGTYTVTYTTAATATCPAFVATASVEIVAPAVATISYGPNTYCNNSGVATVTLTGATGGTFTSDAGLTIDPVTGEVTLASSTIGTHTVTYTTPANGPCAAVPFTATIVISAAFTATIDYGTAPFCTSGGVATVIRTGDAGGVYTTDPSLTIDPATGEITLAGSEAGTYTVTYTIAASGSCQEFVTTAQITIEAAPEATIAYDNTPYCSNGGVATVTFTGTTGGVYSSTPGLVFVSGGDVDLAASTPGTYDVYYTVAATTICAGQQFGPATITITELPVAGISYANSPYCTDGGIATAIVTGTTGGAFTATPAGLTIDPLTGDITLATSTPGAYDVVYTVAAAAGCPAVPATFRVEVTKLPVADFQYQYSTFCTNAASLSPVFVGGGVAGAFTVNQPGLTIDSATGVITPSTSTPGTYIVTNTLVAANGCTPVPVTQTITVDPAPIATFDYADQAYCVEGTAIPTPILDDASGTFTSTPAGLVIDAATGIIDLDRSQPGTYQVLNTITGSPECPSVSASTEVIIASLPVVAVTQGCDGIEYKLTLSLDGDPSYNADDVTIEWTSPTGAVLGSGESQVIVGSGTYKIKVTPKAGAICPAIEDVLVDDTICEIPRGISPNNDGLNDTFDLTGYGVTKISIFNRYGQEVFSHKGAYTNQFSGNAKNGDELPTGAYFYMIVRSTGESKTGWVYINRPE